MSGIDPGDSADRRSGRSCPSRRSGSRRSRPARSKRPSIGELFAPAYARTTIVTTIMFACAFGAAFGAIQHMPRIVPGHPRGRGARARRAAAGRRRRAVVSGVRRAARPDHPRDARGAHRVAPRSCCGSSSSRPVRRADRVLLRGRRLVDVGQVGHLLRRPLHGRRSSASGGTICRAMYPTYLRGTGESFAANVGGRMIGTFAAWVTPKLATSMPGGAPARQLAYAAALVALVVYVGGVVTSFWLQRAEAGRAAGVAGPICISPSAMTRTAIGILAALALTGAIAARRRHGDAAIGRASRGGLQGQTLSRGLRAGPRRPLVRRHRAGR